VLLLLLLLHFFSESPDAEEEIASLPEQKRCVNGALERALAVMGHILC